MKRSKLTSVILAVACLLLITGCQRNHNTTQEPWSVRMIKSEMKRSPQGWMLNFSKDLSWNYCHGLVCSAMLEAASQYNEKSFYNYVKQYADTMVLDNGTIIGYRPDACNLYGITAGRILFPLNKKEQKQKYLSALHHTRNQFSIHPRTSEGGFWHKSITTSQIWLDGVYMALPFYVEYARTFEEPDIYNDAILQLLLIRKYLYDETSGLYYHGWDESRQQQWVDSTGKSPHVWGRSMGWFAMGLVDVLDFIPDDHPQWEEVMTIYQDLMQALVKAQDQKSGVWYQVMDQPTGKGNYLESSASCMFTYALLKGIRKGYLPESYREYAYKAYEGVIKQFITINKDQTLSITQCCEVGGLGGKPYRDGSFEYYIQIPRRVNDPKAVGSFILASLEMEKLSN